MVDYYPGEPWYPVLPKFQIPLIKFCLATALSVGGLVIVGRFLPRSHLFQTLVLQAAAAREEGFVASPDSKNMLGRRGVSQTALRPAGIAVFDGARVNVVTRGDFLNAGENVVVVEAHGNHMVVERISA
jgi:membrane-bound serine protease (ClpP class)